MTDRTDIAGPWRRMLLAAACALGLATPGTAQQGYGCTNLLFSEVIPSLEGADGTFFRIDPDLHAFHWIDDVDLARLATLSDTLAAQGTRLIYVPLPTKALAMPQMLPIEARDLGYDPDLAASVYGEMLDRLRDTGMTAVDARDALRRQGLRGAAPFFGTDPRLTSAGSAALAQAIAAQIGAPPATAQAMLASLSPSRSTSLQSLTRMQLQRHCVTELPPVVAQSYDAPATGLGVLQPAGFGTRRGPAIAIAATEVAGDPALGLAAFVSAATGQRAETLTVPDGDAFAAISAMMTAPGFQTARPDVLVWVNPVWHGLGRRGDQPLAELTAAAGNTCRHAVPLTRTGEATYRADLTRLPLGRGALAFDGNGVQARRAAFHFLSRDGLRRTRAVHRHENAPLTGRFFMPVTGLWPEGATAVEIALDARPDGIPSLTFCEEQ